MNGTVAGHKGFQIQKENWGSNSKGKLASHPFWRKIFKPISEILPNNHLLHETSHEKSFCKYSFWLELNKLPYCEIAVFPWVYSVSILTWQKLATNFRNKFSNVISDTSSQMEDKKSAWLNKFEKIQSVTDVRIDVLYYIPFRSYNSYQTWQGILQGDPFEDLLTLLVVKVLIYISSFWGETLYCFPCYSTFSRWNETISSVSMFQLCWWLHTPLPILWFSCLCCL